MKNLKRMMQHSENNHEKIGCIGRFDLELLKRSTAAQSDCSYHTVRVT